MTPKIPLISTVGDTNGAAPAFDADYWVANLRNPVRFSQAVAAAARNHATFVEISPHPLLTYAIGDTLQSTSSTNRFIVTSALKRGEDETLFFHAQLAAAWCHGPRCRRRPARGYSPVAVAAFEILDRESVARAADCQMLTRCLGCTLRCRRAATMCGRQISEPR